MDICITYVTFYNKMLIEWVLEMDRAVLGLPVIPKVLLPPVF